MINSSEGRRWRAAGGADLFLTLRPSAGEAVCCCSQDSALPASLHRTLRWERKRSPRCIHSPTSSCSARQWHTKTFLMALFARTQPAAFLLFWLPLWGARKIRSRFSAESFVYFSLPHGGWFFVVMRHLIYGADFINFGADGVWHLLQTHLNNGKNLGLFLICISWPVGKKVIHKSFMACFMMLF